MTGSHSRACFAIKSKLVAPGRTACILTLGYKADQVFPSQARYKRLEAVHGGKRSWKRSPLAALSAIPARGAQAAPDPRESIPIMRTISFYVHVEPCPCIFLAVNGRSCLRVVLLVGYPRLLLLP